MATTLVLPTLQEYMGDKWAEAVQLLKESNSRVSLTKNTGKGTVIDSGDEGTDLALGVVGIFVPNTSPDCADIHPFVEFLVEIETYRESFECSGSKIVEELLQQLAN